MIDSLFVFKIKFKNFVKFGHLLSARPVSLVESDALFSALLNTVSIYYGEKETNTLVEEFISNPPFLISSLFPYCKDTYYLPKPLWDDFISNDTKKQLGKLIKKRTLINVEDFYKWLTKNENYFLQRLTTEQFKTEKTSFLKTVLLPKTVLDRESKSTNLYHVVYGKFEPNTGVYGFVYFKKPEYIEKFHKYLILLGKTGLGGERTFGYGQFEVVEYAPVRGLLKDIFLTKTDFYVSLSLIYPEQENFILIKNSLLAYDLTKKGGFICSGKNQISIKKKTVTFLKEGTSTSEPFRGSIVDVTPENAHYYINHKVYKYGYALWVPL